MVDLIHIDCKFAEKWAFFNFEIEDTFEAGICLMGSEVKSLRDGKANLSRFEAIGADAFVPPRSGRERTA